MKNKKFLIISLIIFFIDQLSKYFVMNCIDVNKEIKIIKDFFYLTYTKNTGAAFSMFDGMTFLIVIISIGVFFYLIYELFKNDNNRFSNYGICFIIGGLVGNLVDRLFLGYVRDFLSFIIFNYDAPIFNVSDTFICVGVVLYIIGLFLEERNGVSNKK